MIIYFAMNITENISIVLIIGFGKEFFAVHTIVILCPIEDIHLSVTYTYTYTVSVKNVYKSNA